MSKERATDEALANLLEELHGTFDANSADQSEMLKNKRPRDEIVENHMMRYRAMETSGIQSGGYFSMQAGLPTPYLPCVVSFKELKQLYINDLRPSSHHRGGYVMLRAVTPPLRMSAIISILEDEIGDAVSFQLYQQDEKIQPAVEDIPQGRVCIIKEPWYKPMTDGSYGIRADHVSDVMLLPEADGKIPLKWRPQTDDVAMTATQLKETGNDALKVGKLLEAIER